MAQGRGSTDHQAKFTVALLLCLLVCLQNIDAATYTVGGPGGWTFNMATWPKGKSFRAGDVLGKHQLTQIMRNCLLVGIFEVHPCTCV